MSLSIIIPAYNEEKRIEKTINSVYGAFRDDLELIVVSNGSTDKTVYVLKGLKRKYKSLKILVFKKKLGKGGAIIEGLKIAKKDIMGFLDADDAFDLKEIKKAMAYFKGYDCIIASKWKGQSFFNVDEPFLRKLFSRGWNLLVRLLLGLDFYDTQAGAKFLKKRAYEKISKKGFITKGFEFDVELLYRLKQNNFKVKEIFIPSRFIAGSRFSLKYMPPMFKNLIKIAQSR
ncbi:MAG: glycosyltransferase [Candidatus Woesearchaeota archaeon]|nr:glycosyltransferase [Candidatus Woesearchaeota archaeon]